MEVDLWQTETNLHTCHYSHCTESLQRQVLSQFQPLFSRNTFNFNFLKKTHSLYAILFCISLRPDSHIVNKVLPPMFPVPSTIHSRYNIINSVGHFSSVTWLFVVFRPRSGCLMSELRNLILDLE